MTSQKAAGVANFLVPTRHNSLTWSDSDRAALIQTATVTLSTRGRALDRSFPVARKSKR